MKNNPKCPQCNEIMEKMDRPPLKKRYFFMLRFQGQWWHCRNFHIWTDKGLKKERKNNVQ